MTNYTEMFLKNRQRYLDKQSKILNRHCTRLAKKIIRKIRKLIFKADRTSGRLYLKDEERRLIADIYGKTEYVRLMQSVLIHFNTIKINLTIEGVCYEYFRFELMPKID